MLQVKSFTFNAFQERTILMWDESKEGVVVDPGCCGEEEFKALADEVEKEGIVLKAVWLTHGHIDHIYGVGSVVRKWGVPVMMHHDDIQQLSYNEQMARMFGMPVPECWFPTTDIGDGTYSITKVDDYGIAGTMNNAKKRILGGTVCIGAQEFLTPGLMLLLW